MKARLSVWLGLAVTCCTAWMDAQAQVWTQGRYRWRDDDGSETAANWKAAENTPITGVKRCENLRLRFSLVRNATTYPSMQTYPQVLQYATSAGGPWTKVPEPLASGELPAGAMVAMAATTWFSNYVSTTAQLGSGGAFAGGRCVENQANPPMTMVGGNNLYYYNHEYSIQISPLAPANTAYYFKCEGMNQYNAYAQLTVENANYTNPPTIVSSLAPQTIEGGLAWSYTIEARGLHPLTYAASGLPQGITRTGNVLSGAPTQYGSFPVTLTVSDANGSTNAVLTLNVNSPATEVIVDDADAAHTTKLGTWPASGNTTGAWNGGSYYGDPGVETDALSFRWIPEIPLTAEYRVYARWTDGPYRGRSVPYTIHHAGVTEPEIFADQSALARQWNLLGTYTFNLGTNGWVELGGHDGQACADAVKFERVGAAPLDADADGMLDSWENTYLGGTGASPTADADSDGFNNLQEYLAGTLPNNSNSVLAVTALTGAGGQSSDLSWLSVAGKKYRIDKSTNLTEGFTMIVASNIMANPPTNTYSVTLGTSGSGFYRVKLETGN